MLKKRKRGRATPPTKYFEWRRSAAKPGLDLGGYWSYPIFVREKADRMHWLHLICSVARRPLKKLTAIYRPKVLLTTPVGCAMVASYIDLRHGRDVYAGGGWEKPVGLFPHKDVASLTVKQFRVEEERLLGLALEASREFLKSGSLSAEYRELWLRLTHPGILPYVKPVAPRFFHALKLIAKGKAP